MRSGYINRIGLWKSLGATLTILNPTGLDLALDIYVVSFPYTIDDHVDIIIVILFIDTLIVCFETEILQYHIVMPIIKFDKMNICDLSDFLNAQRYAIITFYLYLLLYSR